MPRKKKPSGKYSKLTKIIRFSLVTDREISRKRLRELFDKERQYLTQDGSTEDIDIARKMSFDVFLNHYCTNDEFQCYFDMNDDDVEAFVAEQLGNYVWDLEHSYEPKGKK